MKQIDVRIKDKSDSMSEDQGKGMKSDVDELTKKVIAEADTLSDAKTGEIEQL